MGLSSMVADDVRSWFTEKVLEGRSIDSLSRQNQYNARNMLAGFLQCCEKFNHLSQVESATLFKELAK